MIVIAMATLPKSVKAKEKENVLGSHWVDSINMLRLNNMVRSNKRDFDEAFNKEAPPCNLALRLGVNDQCITWDGRSLLLPKISFVSTATAKSMAGLLYTLHLLS